VSIKPYAEDTGEIYHEARYRVTDR